MVKCCANGRNDFTFLGSFGSDNLASNKVEPFQVYTFQFSNFFVFVSTGCAGVVFASGIETAQHLIVDIQRGFLRMGRSSFCFPDARFSSNEPFFGTMGGSGDRRDATQVGGGCGGGAEYRDTRVFQVRQFRGRKPERSAGGVSSGSSADESSAVTARNIVFHVSRAQLRD